MATSSGHGSSGGGTATAAAAATAGGKAEILEKLKSLKELLDQDYITGTEYNERKEQLINQLTGTQTRKSTTTTTRTRSGSTLSSLISDTPPKVEPRAPPASFEGVHSEHCKLWVFDPDSGKWSNEPATVQIFEPPFARGALRLCYYCNLISNNNTKPGGVYVAKLSVDPYEERLTYFTDIEIQTYAKVFADRFNGYNPPKKVDFIKAFLLELDERPRSPLCGVEKFISGEYRKHNNNFGYVNDEERNTPQAFSHFTYEASNHQLLICDIQGVGDVYTDPQIHTTESLPLSTRLQGKGNLGTRGLQKFEEVHQCNPICRYLKCAPLHSRTLRLTLPTDFRPSMLGRRPTAQYPQSA
eukprot:TRINITY_DN3889_c0_g1_i1.p1 TRINITY_DN3889_c0_g1~~TRINITY_DN3889_c0_g1_i1.p1  ORF type:complete len:356 (-),score=65.46 TRINITY_DN3889_c0_g1_i1:255-1322(-)